MEKAKNTQCILFDLDNTLWDFDGNAKIALSQLYQKHNLEKLTGKTDLAFIEIYEVTNAEYWRRYEKGEVDKETLRTRRFIDALQKLGLREDLQPKGLWQEYLDICPTIPNLIPNALSTLAHLKKHFKIGLLTNGFEQTQQTKIKCSGIHQHIDFMLSSESFGIPKPRKEIFDKAVEMAGMTHEECIYIGDNRETDVIGGLNAGIKTAWFKLSEGPKVEHPLFLGEYAHLDDFRAYVMGLNKNDK